MNCFPNGGGFLNNKKPPNVELDGRFTVSLALFVCNCPYLICHLVVCNTKITAE